MGRPSVLPAILAGEGPKILSKRGQSKNARRGCLWGDAPIFPQGAHSKFVNPQDPARNRLPGQLNHVGMMGKKEHLSLGPHLRENLKGLQRPPVVQVQEKVVGHKGNGLAGLVVASDRRQA